MLTIFYFSVLQFLPQKGILLRQFRKRTHYFLENAKETVYGIFGQIKILNSSGFKTDKNVLPSANAKSILYR